METSSDVEIESETDLDAVKAEAEELRAKLEELRNHPRLLSAPSQPTSSQSLDQEIDQCQEQIAQIHQELVKEKVTYRKLYVEKEYVQSTITEDNSEFAQLSKRINDLSTENQGLIEAKMNSDKEEAQKSLELMRNKNPKLFFLMSKTMQAEENNQNLKIAMEELTRSRNDIRMEYYDVTSKLTFEDQLKSGQRKMEQDIENYEKKNKDLEAKLNTRKYQLKDFERLKDRPHVKKYLRRFHTLEKEHQYFQEKIRGIYDDLDECELKMLEKTKGLTKMTETETCRRLREEIKLLETQIINMTKEDKDKEKQLKELKFNYEEIGKQVTVFSRCVTPMSLSQNEQKPAVVQEKETGNPKKKKMSEEQKRQKLVILLEKELKEGQPAKVLKELKNIGKPNQGIATKIVEINRGEFLMRYKQEKPGPSLG